MGVSEGAREPAEGTRPMCVMMTSAVRAAVVGLPGVARVVVRVIVARVAGVIWGRHLADYMLT